MPPSSEQETQPIPFNRGSTPRQAQKGTPPGAIPTKKERKNGAAKDSSGAPEVTKPGPKTSDMTKTSAASLSSRLQSTESRMSYVAPEGSTTTSPLLEALSSNAFRSSTTQNTNEWARNVPAFSGSPGNLISLSGSPPTMPSSYEDRSILSGWNHRERGASNGHLPSASPPINRRRPLSFQMDGHQPFDDQASQNMGYANRRSSVYSQQAQRYAPNPPLPHQPQAHFYGAPDAGFGLPSRASQMKPGTNGYYCGFDSLNLTGPGALYAVDSAFISGYQGGLDVYGISKHSPKKIASLEDLRGGVFYAKILPWTLQGESQPNFPLIAIVLHGPVLYLSEESAIDPTIHAVSEVGSIRRNGGIGSVQSSPPPERNVESITHFQTTVEVYSLKTGKRICTLLSLPKIPLAANTISPLLPPPLATGALSISADAGTVVVASGITGELWIYRQNSAESQIQMGFRCIGKVWTTVQHGRAHDPTRSPDFTGLNPPYKESQSLKQQYQTALFSLKGRWLAYSPPSYIGQVPLRAVVPIMASTARSPGLNTHAPPQAPAPNCAVDMPEGETLLNRVAREATQAAIKGAKWVGGQGVQVWNSYWNKPSTVSQANVVGNTQFWHNPHQPQPEIIQGFPPTHGEAVQQASSNSDPMLVSILDIEKLASNRTTSSSVSPYPFATFKTPLGCSFLSFSPSGLALFTASSKGEVQFIWDLMRVYFTKSSALQNPRLSTLQGQHVRQVAIFTRMTPARIVDVIWTTPHGERIAMVTDRSTVHFWDLHLSAFSWPPLRRRIKNLMPNTRASGEGIETAKSAAGLATSAVSAAWNLAQPLMKRPRGLSGPGRPSITAAGMTAQAGQGGKALANGISKSFGAATGTLESFYKSGENRLHLPRGSTMLTMNCIEWLRGQKRDYMAASVDGTVMIYAIRQRKTSRSDKQRISISRNPTTFELPSIPDHNIAPAVLRAMDLEDDLELAETENEARWNINRPSVVKADATSGTESPIPQAEIESNAPYQPFHTDRCVGLQIFANKKISLGSPSTSAFLAPLENTSQQSRSSSFDASWVFGGPICATKLHVGPSQNDNDNATAADDYYALPSSAIERVTTKISEADEETEQIVITTRRRRGTLRGNTGSSVADEDGFFEDDCEVLDFASQRV